MIGLSETMQGLATATATNNDICVCVSRYS